MRRLPWPATYGELFGASTAAPRPVSSTPRLLRRATSAAQVQSEAPAPTRPPNKQQSGPPPPNKPPAKASPQPSPKTAPAPPSSAPASTTSPQLPAEPNFVFRAPHASTHPSTYVERKATHVPLPLSRPLGQLDPPKPSENDGIDRRPWRQRRDEFLDYDRHVAKRRAMTRAMAKPYYYDWNRIGKAKAFVAPAQLLRADRARYFPNLRGATLAAPQEEADAAPALRGRVSIVTLVQGGWAEAQARAWVDGSERLQAVLRAAGEGVVQRVRLNYEDNWMKMALIRLFMGRLKRGLPAADHARYFLVRRGMTEDLKATLGIFNILTGTTYLTDGYGRIRWAGSADPSDEERESLVRGTVRLVAEMQRLQAEGKAVGKPWPAKELMTRVYDDVTAVSSSFSKGQLPSNTAASPPTSAGSSPGATPSKEVK